MIALGVVFHRNAYFRSAWNWLDFIAVVSSALTLSLSSFNFGALRAARHPHHPPAEGHAARRGPARRSSSASSTVRSLGNLALVAVFFQLLFAVMGVQLFKGGFYFCTGDSEAVCAAYNGTDCPFSRTSTTTAPPAAAGVQLDAAVVPL